MAKPSKDIITAALEYYQAGHSRYECADKYGLTHGQVMYYAKKYRVSGGMSQQQRGEYAKAAQMKATAASASIARERAIVSNNDKRIRKEWRDLNDELVQWRKSLDLFDYEISKVSKAFNKLDSWISCEFDWYKDCLVKHEPQIAVCNNCGKKWIFWPINETDSDSYRKWSIPTYCSEKYKRKKYRKYRSNHRSRARHFGVEFESGITLDKVEERFDGICYLCGGKTDRRDRIILRNGYQVTGACYPTIDHMIPMVRGGGHVWPNTKLSHRQCNSLKSDKLLSELQLPFNIPKGQ